MQKPRPYQEKTFSQINEHYQKGHKKVLLHLPTGSGKTFIFCELLKRTANNNKRAIMVVRGRELVDQASKRLLRENVYHGVLMANHYLYRPMAPIQICSIDTLRSRSIIPDADFIVWDEAHLMATAYAKELASNYKDKFHLPVTATPYPEKSLRHIADHIINPISMDELIEQKYLVGPRYFGSKEIDFSKVKKQGNDFNNKQLFDIFNKNDLIADVVETYIKKGEERTNLVFCCNVEHSKNTCEKFKKAGLKFEHIDAKTCKNEREDKIQALNEKMITGITNCGVLTTGVDIPSLGAVTLNRATLSLNLFRQMCGRGTRPFTNKTDFLLFDHGNNTGRHGWITTEIIGNLEGKTPVNNGPIVHTCPKCYAYFEGRECPECGFILEKKELKKEYVNIEGELVELTKENMDEYRTYQAEKRYKELKKMALRFRYSKKTIYHTLVKEFDRTLAKKMIPNWFL